MKAKLEQNTARTRTNKLINQYKEQRDRNTYLVYGISFSHFLHRFLNEKYYDLCEIQ